MTDPTKPETDKEKFAPQNVANADKDAQKGREQERSDLARGSETATRQSGGRRG